jgi:hypothetical protein
MSSYLKTIALLGLALLVAVAAAGVGVAAIGGITGSLIAVAGTVVALGLCVAIAGGCVVLWRETRRLRGGPDPFLEITSRRRELELEQASGFRAGAVRRWLARRFVGHDLLPGDVVRIRPLPEILATLDSQGALDGMPFQPEMMKFCGSEARVFRCLDKIYDYGRTKHMRRLDGCVLLSKLRCNGSAHDGCEADCYLIWKTEWLQQPSQASTADTARPATIDAARVADAVVAGTRQGEVFRCQFTQLHACTTEYPRWSLGRDLIPWLSGNYSAKAWLVAILTRVFNGVQRRRGGLGFPPQPPVGEHLAKDPTNLSVGERVTVLPLEEIARTLNSQGKNKGLWFDVEMVKHCRQEYRVSARVQKIIDDATGQVRFMKTPCIMLETVDSTGEGLHFNAQHDPIFWRESWLRRTESQS